MHKTTVAIAASALLCLGTVQAYAAPRITAEVKTTPDVTLSAGESRAVSIAAGRLLKHTSDARLAIMDEDGKEALSEVEKGLSLVTIIEAAVPSYTVKAKIEAGGTVYEDEDTEKLRVVPIFDELDKVSMIAPLQHVRSEAEKKNKVIGKPVVADVGIDEMRVSLDITLAKAGLNVAKTKLGEDKLKEADAALAMVQDSVFVTTVFADLPLERARENLMLAKANVEHGDLKKAQAELESAMESLKGFEATAEKKLAKAAEVLREDIGKLANGIEENEEGAGKKITGWWDKVGEMMKR